MKYSKIIERIQSGNLSRQELFQIKDNAERAVSKGDDEAKDVVKVINKAVPADSYILFMGFCPSGKIANRLDIEWKEKGICECGWEGTTQRKKFEELLTGDLIVLKKRERIGETMKVYGHGRVTGVLSETDDAHILSVDWSDQNNVIEVPLMGCNATVNIRDMAIVRREMPEDFWNWLDNA